MCWTMTIPGAVAGIPVSTASMALVPPVEAPMAITLWVVCTSRFSTTGRAADSAVFTHAVGILATAAERMACASGWAMSLME